MITPAVMLIKSQITFIFKNFKTQIQNTSCGEFQIDNKIKRLGQVCEVVIPKAPAASLFQMRFTYCP